MNQQTGNRCVCLFVSTFQLDLSHLKPRNESLVRHFERLFVVFRMSVWFCISVCASLCRVVTAQQGMTGQPREVPVNGTEVQAAARFAVVEFNRDNAEDQFAYKLLNITSAKTQVTLHSGVDVALTLKKKKTSVNEFSSQVVAGINLILEVRLGRTVCKSSDTSDGEACGLNKELKASSIF